VLKTGLYKLNLFADKNRSLVERTMKNGVFRGGYQQIAGFFNKKALFFAKTLV
jgi:hypothetical protein